MTILGKKQMSEEDIKLNYITPVILNGWKGHITMETKITDGRINISGNIVARSKSKFADYMLYLNDGKPIAVVEAKDNNHSVSHGLQQAMTYAQMMDLPFAYSSNGDAFYEHDFLTGQEQQIDLDKFPTQDELVARYYAELNGGKGISDTEKKIVSQPYYSSQSTYPPRYYQRNAVNRTVEAIARGQQRLLLVMATGTGKTYTAFQIVYRLLRSDLKKRILYLADRNILVDQSILQDFAPLEKTIYKVDFSDKECLSKIASHEVNFALYHQMVGQNDEEHFKQIPAEYFDLIIVDECHRGSAKEDSNWRKVLEYFSSATQIGMTATPKESEKVSNIDYFGNPVYTYSLKQGIEDGFLAPFKVINITTNIGDGWRPHKGQTDIAVIWSGIESLFNVNTEVSFRISLYIANFLGENEAQAQQIFKQVRKIYSSRSSAVHGNKTKDNLESAVEESANLLTRILRRCAELNKLPDVDNLAFRVDKQKQGIKCKILVP